MKNLLSITGLIALVVFFLYVFNMRCAYLVRIEFCDGREDIEVVVEAQWPPSTNSIDTQNGNVPKYNGYLNVCAVYTIKKIQP